jgi:hypothetical protein
MNGASKLNEQEVDKILEMVSLGMNDCQVARLYKTPTNQTISRVHVRQIRIGKRWNAERRSFIHKDELLNSPSIETEINGNRLKTEIAILMLKSSTRYLILTSLNDELIDGEVNYTETKPTIEDLIETHISLMNEHQRKD